MFNIYADLGVKDSLKKIKDLYIQNGKMYGFIFFSIKGFQDSTIWIRGKKEDDTISLSKNIYET